MDPGAIEPVFYRDLAEHYRANDRPELALEQISDCLLYAADREHELIA